MGAVIVAFVTGPVVMFYAWLPRMAGMSGLRHLGMRLCRNNLARTWEGRGLRR